MRVTALLLGIFALILPTRGASQEDNGDGKEFVDHQEAVHESMIALNFGEGLTSYWLFEPSEPSPEEPVPVVVFFHGWMSSNPGIYGAWIAHLTRRGNVVIFPRYQDGWMTPPGRFMAGSVDAIHDALDVLQTGTGHPRPDLDRVAFIGHSAGGNLAAQLAAVSEQLELPTPKAVVAVFPGEVLPSTEPNLATIPAETRLLVAASEEDAVVGDTRARQIFLEATLVPLDQKEFLLVRSDRKAVPPLVADHTAPTARLSWLDTGEGPFRALQMDLADIDRIDTAVLWPAADLTLEAGFEEKGLDDLIRQSPTLSYLGQHDDGTPIRAPLIDDDLAKIPRVIPRRGIRLVPWPTRILEPVARPDALIDLGQDPLNVPN